MKSVLKMNVLAQKYFFKTLSVQLLMRLEYLWFVFILWMG